MKTNKILSLLLAVLFLTAGMQLFAQRGGNRMINNADNNANCRIAPMQYLDLDEAQSEKAQVMFTKMRQTQVDLKADLAIKKAELDKMLLADAPDENAITKNVEAIGDIKTEMAKVRTTHRLNFRKILNADQRSIYDSRMLNKRSKRNNKSGRKGQGRNGRGGNNGDCRLN